MENKKWLLFPTLLSSSCLLITPLFSCAEHTATGPVIFEPLEYDVHSIIASDGNSSVKFSNFHYDGIDNYRDLTIQTTFKKGVAQFSPSILNWNTQSKTFDIKINIFGGVETDYVGDILFYYKSKPVYTNFASSFKISLYLNRTIADPQSGTTITHLLMPDETKVVVYFDGFTYGGFAESEFEWTNVSVSNSQIAAVGGSCYIDTIRETEKTFSVCVEIQNIQELPKPLILSDKFDFFYNNILMTHNDISLFTINIIDDAFVTQPDSSTNDVIINDGAGSVLIKNFQLSSIMTPDMVKIKSTFEQSEESEFNCEIINWSPTYKTFDIKVNMSNVDIGFITGKFEFLHNDVKIRTNDSEFTFNVMSCFPNKYLDIEESVDARTGQLIEKLKGFTNDLPPNPPYNLLLIPPYVTDVADSAFKETFTSTKHSVQLKFDDGSVIESLGDRAFEKNLGLVGNLNIPLSINHIGSHCFDGCGFDGELHLSTNSHSDTVCDVYSFFGCKFNSMYLSKTFAPFKKDLDSHQFDGCMYTTLVDLTDTSSGKNLPDWIINMEPRSNHIFWNLGVASEVKTKEHTIVCNHLNGTEKALLKTNLEFCGLDLSEWEIIS